MNKDKFSELHLHIEKYISFIHGETGREPDVILLSSDDYSLFVCWIVEDWDKSYNSWRRPEERDIHYMGIPVKRFTVEK
jgi:hypothetical protein